MMPFNRTAPLRPWMTHDASRIGVQAMIRKSVQLTMMFATKRH